MTTLRTPAQRRPLVFLCALLIAVAAAGAAFACPIPVFQYSLEYWEPDHYQITIYHSGELSGADKEAAESLTAAASDEKKPSNIMLQFVDLATRDIEAGADYEALPHVELRYPAAAASRKPVWSGKLTPDTVKTLLDSPARQKIATLLLARKSAVWLLLESGDREKDDAAANLLEQEITRLEKTLVLPDPAAFGWGGSKDILAPIAFAMMRVRRDDPAEAVFVRMLLASEPDLVEFHGEPIVFPIYGRGLILYALIGRGINEWTIAQAAEFLTAPCSCQVKALNPGLDILMRVNWNGEVVKLSREAIQGPVGAAGFIERMQEAEEKLKE